MNLLNSLNSMKVPLSLGKTPLSSLTSDGLFPLPDLDSDSDSIVLCRTFFTGSDSDSDPCSDGFPNGYRMGQMSVPVLLYFSQGIRVRIQTSRKILLSTGIRRDPSPNPAMMPSMLKRFGNNNYCFCGIKLIKWSKFWIKVYSHL